LAGQAFPIILDLVGVGLCFTALSARFELTCSETSIGKLFVPDDRTKQWLRRGYSLAEIQRIFAWARSEHIRLNRFTGPANGGAAEKLNWKRFSRDKVRARLKRFYKYRPLNIPKLLLASRMQVSPLLDELLPARAAIWTSIARRQVRDILPEVTLSNFSFVHNPIGTITQLGEILKIEATELQARLNFGDHACQDIGAYLVLQAIRNHMAPVFTGGLMSTAMQKVIDAVGLRVPLNMAPFYSVRDHNDVWPFHLQLRRPGRSRSASRFLEPQTIEIVADRFVLSVNEWLALVAHRQLTSGGRRLVLKIVGEALNNAERHSIPNSDDGDWAITGYLAREKSQVQGEVYKCYIAFLSIGSSVAESVATGPKQMLVSMEAYVSKHRGRHFDEEALQTVFALQDGVTKNHEAIAGHRGGTGFQDILDFFTSIGDATSKAHQAKLAIVSGSTCINVSDPYMKGMQKEGVLSERELWFNKEYSQEYPPSRDHVLHLPGRLHGTLVSMVFAVDREYLEAKSNA
jgi:hypothetical protein